MEPTRNDQKSSKEPSDVRNVDQYKAKDELDNSMPPTFYIPKSSEQLSAVSDVDKSQVKDMLDPTEGEIWNEQKNHGMANSSEQPSAASGVDKSEAKDEVDPKEDDIWNEQKNHSMVNPFQQPSAASDVVKSEAKDEADPTEDDIWNEQKNHSMANPFEQPSAASDVDKSEAKDEVDPTEDDIWNEQKNHSTFYVPSPSEQHSAVSDGDKSEAKDELDPKEDDIWNEQKNHSMANPFEQPSAASDVVKSEAKDELDPTEDDIWNEQKNHSTFYVPSPSEQHSAVSDGDKSEAKDELDPKEDDIWNEQKNHSMANPFEQPSAASDVVKSEAKDELDPTEDDIWNEQKNHSTFYVPSPSEQHSAVSDGDKSEAKDDVDPTEDDVWNEQKKRSTFYVPSPSEQHSAVSDGDKSEASDELDPTEDEIWKKQKNHIFVLSEAGKPIYSLHGNEDKLAKLVALLMALMKFVETNKDTLKSIHVRGIKFVFMMRRPLILVAASRTKISVEHLQLRLNAVYDQILSCLTFLLLYKNCEDARFDVRRILGRSGERLLNNLLNTSRRTTNNRFLVALDSICVFALCDRARSRITNAIRAECSKNKKLLLAVLIADKKLVTLVHRKRLPIYARDLRLIFNLLESLELNEESNNWVSICLPNYNNKDFLFAHTSEVAEECHGWLLLLSEDSRDFDNLSKVKAAIKDRLHRSHCFDAIQEEMKERGTNIRLDLRSFPELRHFIYKPNHIAQLLCSDILPPYGTPEGFERLEGIYCDLVHRLHQPSRPLKVLYERNHEEVVLALKRKEYEVYAVFEPVVKKRTVTNYIDSLKNFIEKDLNIFFIVNYSKFRPGFKIQI